MVYATSGGFTLRPDEKKQLYTYFKQEFCNEVEKKQLINQTHISLSIGPTTGAAVDAGYNANYSNNNHHGIDNNQLHSVKLAYLSYIRSRRRVDQIQTLKNLLDELERCGAIDAVAGRVNLLENLVRKLVGEDHPLLQEFKNLLSALNPQARDEREVAGRVVLDRLGSRPQPIPDIIVNLIASKFDMTKGGSKDWEHLSTGLGYGLPERDQIRILQGEVDSIEREEDSSTSGRLRRVFRLFESRCREAGLDQINLVAHIADLLNERYIFDPPFKKLAKEVKSLT